MCEKYLTLARLNQAAIDSQVGEEASSWLDRDLSFWLARSNQFNRRS